MFKGFFDFLSVLFITKYSKRPLHIFGFIGFLLFVAGLIINIILSYQWISNKYYLDLPYSIDRPLLFLGILLVLIGRYILKNVPAGIDVSISFSRIILVSSDSIINIFSFKSFIFK